MSVSVVEKPPVAGANSHYVSNRPPLQPSPLLRLPIGAIKPRGWLRGQLELEAEGMTGRLEEISPWCNPEGNAWLSPTGEGHSHWEELPYWLKGYGDLGYVLGDEAIIERARFWIEGILGSARPDGYFGPQANREANDLWPNMIALDCLQSYYEYSGDPRALKVMSDYFRWQMTVPEEELFPGSWQKVRAGDNLASVLWLYNRTGEDFLLQLAERIHRRTANWTGGVASTHGVNICQCFREPAVYWQLAGHPDFLRAAIRNYEWVMSEYGQVPGGMFGADENYRKGYTGPRQGAETCSIVEFMRSFEIMARITGDTVWADRCEEVAFNSFPASMTPDLKGLHYLTAPNQVQLDAGNKSPGVENGGCMFAYSPDARYRCCQHNVSHGWPYFAEELWHATLDEGLCATLYAPCEVGARVRGGGMVRIAEQTDYPFGETIRFVFSTGEPATFPLYLRVPGWCEGATVSVNGRPVELEARPGSYILLERRWSGGDVVELTLPMRVRVRVWERNHGTVSVDRGPLTYSLAIEERWERLGGSDEWPDWEVFPASPWNYGLVLEGDDPAASFEVVRRSETVPAQPFTPQTVPLALRARARRIPEWQLDRLGLVGEVQESPAYTTEPVETVTLIPMGAARLRISAFPRVSDDPRAHRWTPPAPQQE